MKTFAFVDNRRPHKNYSKFTTEEKFKQTEELDNGNLYNESGNNVCCTDQQNKIDDNDSTFADFDIEDGNQLSEDSDYGKFILMNQGKLV